jgi:hypothetical protein
VRPWFILHKKIFWKSASTFSCIFCLGLVRWCTCDCHLTFSCRFCLGKLCGCICIRSRKTLWLYLYSFEENSMGVFVSVLGKLDGCICIRSVKTRWLYLYPFEENSVAV